LKGYKRQRSTGSWEIFIDYGRDPATGKRKQHTETIRGSAGDADRRIRSLIDQVEGNSFVPSKRITFGEWLKQWYESYVVANTRSRTAASYRDEIHNHIGPRLGQVRLSQLSSQHLQEYYAQALSSGRADGGGGLSASTVLYHHRIISKALKYAVRTGVLARNPAEMVDPPRRSRREVTTLAPRHIPRFLTAIRESQFFVLFYTAFSTGLRLGELLALTWRDIDLDTGFLSVTKAFTKRSGIVEVREPKTAYSRRRIDMSASLVRLLREHRRREQGRGEMLSRSLEETDLVFCYPVNRPLDPTTVSRNFTRLIRGAGLPHLTFHGLRHSHASLLIASGVDIKTVSARLGHASTSFTLDVYGHVLPGNQVAAEKFDQVVLSELIRDGDGEDIPEPEPVTDVSKMLAKGDPDPSKKGGNETEPRRTRTFNLLIKSQLLCQLS